MDKQQAGPALDALVGEHVMGLCVWTEPPWERTPVIVDNRTDTNILGMVPPYSDSMEVAWQMEEAIERRGLAYTYAQRLTAIVLGREIDVTLFEEGGHVTPAELWALAHATPEQRCRAALASVGVGDA